MFLLYVQDRLRDPNVRLWTCHFCLIKKGPIVGCGLRTDESLVPGSHLQYVDLDWRSKIYSPILTVEGSPVGTIPQGCWETTVYDLDLSLKVPKDLEEEYVLPPLFVSRFTLETFLRRRVPFYSWQNSKPPFLYRDFYWKVSLFYFKIFYCEPRIFSTSATVILCCLLLFLSHPTYCPSLNLSSGVTLLVFLSSFMFYVIVLNLDVNSVSSRLV